MNFKQTVQDLPKKPGVYRFYNQIGDLLYIGKAKNLKNRVGSYFQNQRLHSQRIGYMVSQIYRIEYTVVDSEKESLILEANLIHNLQPKYNILLKDDKDYLYIRISNHPVPSVVLARQKYDPKSIYFGPFTQKSGVRELLRVLRLIFPFCNEKEVKNRFCSYYSIKQCDGICGGQESLKDYLKKIDQIKKVLEGKTEQVEAFLTQKMQQAVDIKNFELAAVWRDRLNLLAGILENQKIVLPKNQDLDVITLISKVDQDGLQIGSVFVQNIRAGRMINVNNYLLAGSEGLEDQSFSFLQRFFTSYYSNTQDRVEVMLQVFEEEESL
jgi:excinuclease ABC subunit C